MSTSKTPKRPARAVKRAFKLPTLAAFKKLPLIERTKLFARWCATQTGEYAYFSLNDCALARFAKALSRGYGCASGFHFYAGTAMIDISPEMGTAIADAPHTFPALTKRLNTHIAAQS